MEVNFLCYSSAERKTDAFANPDILFQRRKKKNETVKES